MSGTSQSTSTSSADDGRLRRYLPPPVLLPSLVALPEGGGTWTEQYTARALRHGLLAHPILAQVGHAHACLEGNIIQQFAQDTGLALLDAHRELFDRFEPKMVAFEEWLVDRRPSTRGWYGPLVEWKFGHHGDTIAVENYLETEKNPKLWADTRLAWERHAEYIRAMTIQLRLDRKLRKPRGS